MDWIEICIEATSASIDLLADILLEEGVTGLVIEDGADFNAFLESNRQYWDYVDEELRIEKQAQSQLKFYVEEGRKGGEALERVKALLEELPLVYPDSDFGTLALSKSPVKSEDWENGYKRYYKAAEVGKSLLILPSWEAAPETERKILRLDPGISFGTGTHATTKLCLMLLEENMPAGAQVLDIGCGGGILAIAAMLLGAKRAKGVDIDPLSQSIAGENAALNGLLEPACEFIRGDVLSDRELRQTLSAEKYDFILANIVADVIMPLSAFVRDFMRPGARFICSGILDARAAGVEAALLQTGHRVLQKRSIDGWTAFLSE